jgi:hypothetical protein
MMPARGLRQSKHVRMILLSGSSRRLVLLAPPGARGLGCFRHIHTDAHHFTDKLADMQRLRGDVYLRLGAIEPGQLTGGRHQLDVDDESWHLLALDQEDQVCGCIRYREHSNNTGFSQLGVAHSTLARCEEWGPKLEAAVEAELALSRRLRLPYVEVGGWALLEQIRGTTEALRMALTMYGLSRRLGGAVGITTANNGNCSASILRRIGGLSLEHKSATLPPYHDPQYKREIEVLRFYSWAPNPRYETWIKAIRSELLALPVITKAAAAGIWSLGKLSATRLPRQMGSPIQFAPPTTVH